MRRFKTLLAIAETGTFAGAASKLHLTPAAVSQQMKVLEEEMGVSLFDRSRRPPQLNPAGYALVPKVQSLLESYEDMLPGRSSRPRTETLTLGAVPTTMTGLMPKALKALSTRQSNLHLRIFPGMSEELYPQLDRGAMDAVILSQPVNVFSHLHWWPFAKEPMVLLASNKTISDDPFELLSSQPFIRFSRRAWVGRLIDEWLIKQKIQVTESMELDTLESISAMVYNGLGVSIVPMRCCPSPRPLPLKRIMLGGNAKPRTLGVLLRRDSPRFESIRLLHREMVRIVESAGVVRVVYPGED